MRKSQQERENLGVVATMWRCRHGHYYRTATVSTTYVVGFVSFLAEYFPWHPFYPMFTGLRRGLLAGPTLALRSNTALSRPRLCSFNRR
jgi:hypothetical protein